MPARATRAVPMSRPSYFEVRDDDKAFVKLETPPAALQEKLKLAIKLCPRQAISVED